MTTLDDELIDEREHWRPESPPIEVWCSRIFIAFPIVCLLINALSWLRYGIDLPMWDDWRIYRAETMGSFDLGYLFTPVNDTLFPVGQFFDSLAFRFLDGNSVAYQFVTLVVALGLLLALQWKLLGLVFERQLFRAAAFSLTLLMMQPESYWGWQNLAYHQVVPLVAVLAMILVLLGGRWRGKFGVAGLLILGFIAGFSYISGAFATLAIAVVMTAGSWCAAGRDRRVLRQGGAALLVIGAVAAAAQLWVIIGVQGGTHSEEIPLVMPTDPHFWLTFMGKFGRSLMLPIDHSLISFVVSCLAMIVVVGLVAWSIRSLVRNRPISLEQSRPYLIYLALIAAVAVYLILVAAGRTSTAPPDATGLDVFSFGFYRFHYYWVTSIWPWVFALLLILCGHPRVVARIPRAQSVAAYVLPAVLLPLISVGGAFNHGSYYESTAERRAAAVECLLGEAQKLSSDYYCEETDIEGIGPGFEAGARAGASYGRLIRPMPIPMGTDTPAPLLRVTDSPKALKAQNTTLRQASDGTFVSPGGVDASILIDVGNPAVMLRCGLLQVSAQLRVIEDDMSVLFYRHPKTPGFTPKFLEQTPVASSQDFASIDFLLASKAGFADQLRLDPVALEQPFEIKDIEVRCRRNLE